MPFDIDQVRSRLEGMERADPARMWRTISALARPRMTASDEAADVERDLRRRFEDLGYETEVLPFSFSTWPGRFGLSAAGAALAVTGILGTALLLWGMPAGALALLLLGMALALLPLLLLDTALERLPYGRVDAANLLFRRPDARPAWILMAHRDSKSQLVPTLVRTAAIVGGVAAWLLLVVLALLWFGGESFRFPGLASVAGAVLVLASLLLALSWAANESPGALDNATGLAALCEVAADNHTGEVAFLLTDGEELGLAGARAVAQALPAVQGVINVDGLDDDGDFRVAEGYGWRRRGSAPQLAAALLTAAAALDLPITRAPLPRSVPVDHMPLAEAGVPAVTLLRGGWKSLLRVHRPGDHVHRLHGAGTADGATLLRAAVRILRETGPGHLAARRAAGS